MLKEINQGGSHESNPLGGVPMGMNNQGTPVTYEQGETAMPTNTGEYVFSDRLKVTKDMAKRLSLPKSLVGKSFADASKHFNNKFKERTDKISESTKNKFLDGLVEAQEVVKQEEAAKIANAMGINSTEVPDMMNGQIPQGMESFSKQMNGGGFVDDLATTGSLNQAPAIDGVGISNPNKGAGIAGALGSLSSAVGGSTGNLALSRAGTYASIGGTVGSVIPGVGTAIGAAAGAVVGGVSGLVAQGNRERKASNKRDVEANKFRDMFTDNYANGGHVKHMPNGGSRSFTPQFNPFERGMFFNPNNWNADYNGDTGLVEGTMDDLVINVDRNETKVEPSVKATATTNPPPKDPKTDEKKIRFKDPLRALRYAPILANAYQLAKLEKPTAQAPMIDDAKARRDYVDTNAALERINSESNAAINTLTQTGMTGGALRNSITATMLNRSRALGDTALQADAMNKQIDSQADQIDRQTNLRNMAEHARVREAYDRDLGMYNTNKSGLIGQLGNDIGGLGSEALNRDLVREMYGYGWDGKYFRDKDGKKLTPAEFAAKYGRGNESTDETKE